MHTQIIPRAGSQTVPRPLPPDGPPAVDEGLRSAGGIRWLLWIGALVVGVSVVGLLAARWGELPAAVQFLVLAAGAVGLQAAGDVTRRRLRLPVTGAALYFLFAALVPLLAWGAGWLRLVEAPLGGLSLALGLGALLWAVRRVLTRVLEEKGRGYHAALGLLLFAPAILRFIEDHFVTDRPSFFLAVAVALGLVVRFASRHVNRTLFHRDRATGRERRVHALPFALLALVYLLGLSLLAAHAAHVAVPLVFLAVALVDTGEEYYRALAAATSRVPARWPRRSVGQLTAGFALMAVAGAASLLDGGLRSAAIVATVVAARLFAWALRYRHGTAYGAALTVGLVAYHLSPALMPEAVRELFHALVVAVGLRPGSTAVLGLADLGILAALAALGALLRRRLTPAMQVVHVAALTFQTLIVSAAVLFDPGAACTIVPAAVLLLAGGLFLLRRLELVPALYLAAAHGAVVWVAKLLGASVPLDEEGLLALGTVSLLFAAAAVAYRHLRPAAGVAGAAWIALPPLLGASVVGLAALAWLHAPMIAGALLLAMAGTVFLAALAVDQAPLALAAVLVAWAGSHLAAYGAGGETVSALALGGYAWLAASWGLERGAAARPESFVGRTRPAWSFAVALGAVGGVLWLVSGLYAGVATVVTPYLALLGLVLVDVARRHARQETTSVPSGTLAAGLGLVALWPAVQLAATGAERTAVALAVLLAAIAERVAAEVLERRGQRDLARPCMPMGAALAAAAGVLAVATTATMAGSPWWPVLPGFLASLFFVFLARDGYERVFSSLAAVGLFAAAFTVLIGVAALAPEMYWLPPGLALIGLSWLLRREAGARWSARLFTVGAGCLYAVPVLGLLEEISWGWQILLLLLAIAFGAASFQLRSRSLLTLSTGAAVVDLAFFLLKLGRTAPLLLWAAGIVFGLALMGAAMALEYRREAVLQKIRLWGREIRSW